MEHEKILEKTNKIHLADMKRLHIMIYNFCNKLLEKSFKKIESSQANKIIVGLTGLNLITRKNYLIYLIGLNIITPK